ncbi:lytic polysaccharide monooxygenase [Brucella pituitosa]|uniref:Lytic polysaccharide monooxygenase n=1 Tax=Brucella pituitosa TaxID=571256 RepID=A0ABS3K5V5_9HYPH|nr:lytic polysaccharide monooxygenase [Brucella pituitosa]MBO1042283.1 lytic polysaccharide monooxygenase [Brucella pituitosa]
MTVNQVLTPFHGHVFGPDSRAMFAHREGKLNYSDINSLEAGKFFPATKSGLVDPIAPDDAPSGTPPADGQIASAGWKPALFLDEPGTHWKKHQVRSGEKITISWDYSARHATRRWNYFITRPDWNPGKKLSRASFEDKPFYKVELSAQPFWAHPEALWPASPTTHDVVLPERNGYHVLLAVWEVANTAMAFYQVVDLEFVGSSSDQRPGTPSGLHAAKIDRASVDLAWSPPSGPSPANYTIFRDGFAIQKVDGLTTSCQDRGLEAETTYRYSISATSPGGQESLPSQEVAITTLADDYEQRPPSAPDHLHSMGETSATVSLMWGASTGARPIAGYQVYRDGVLVVTTNETALVYDDGGLASDTEYRYFVAAVDIDDQLSVPSNVLTIRTKAADSTPPVTGTPDWKLNSYYATGDRVRYNNVVYVCLQSHTSHSPSWNPAEAHGILWRQA